MIYILGLGSNIGNREMFISQATGLLADECGSVLAESQLIETEPEGFVSTNRFLNAVVVMSSAMSPQDMLSKTQDIERRLGRMQKTEISGGSPVYHDRTIDIDLLMVFNDTDFYTCLQVYHDRQLSLPEFVALSIPFNTPTLTLPHPHLLNRTFVTTPLLYVLGNKKISIC